MPVVRMPDGKLVRFPDEMSREEIKAFVVQRYPDAYKPQEEKAVDLSEYEWTPEMQRQAEAIYAEDAKRNPGVGSVALAGITGYGEGIENLTNRAVNGATLGGFDWLDRKGGGEAAALRNRIHENVDRELGTAGNVLLGAGELGSEIAGNIYGGGGAITKGLAKTGLKGMGLGLTDAAVQGGAYGATSADNWGDVPANMVIGAVGGVAAGGALSGARGVLGKVAGLFRSGGKDGKSAKVAMDYMRKELGDDAVNAMIKEARDSNRSILEVVEDPKVLKMLQRSRMQTDAADDIIQKNALNYNKAQGDRNQAFVDDVFGRKSGYAMKKEATAAAKQEAKPYFDEMEGMGDLAKYETRDLPEQNFKRWFEGSKVVDENGQPLTYYHGTPNKFDAFNKDKIVRGNGFWFTDDMNYASSIRANEGEPTVLQTYLNAKNPIDVNKNRDDFIKLSKEYFGNSRDFSDVGDNFIIGEAMSDKGFPEFLKSKGYDAIKMGNGIEVFEPNQIKSVNNSGAWSSSPSLSDAGWTPESQSPLANLVKENDVIADTIKGVKRSLSSLKKASDTDARVLLEARKVLSAQTKNADGAIKMQAINALDELDPVLKDVFGGKLETANKIYRDAYKFQEAYDAGRQVFDRSVPAEEFADILGKMTANERQALKGGLKDEVYGIITNRANETLGWNRVVPRAVQDKIRMVLGEKEGSRLINYANQEIRAMRNINEILKGSKTAEKTMLSKIKDWKNAIYDAATGRYYSGRNRGIANVMTNPNAEVAERAFDAVANPKGWEAVYQALVNPKSGQAKYNAALAAYLSNQTFKEP